MALTGLGGSRRSQPLDPEFLKELENPSFFEQTINAVFTPINFALDILDTPAGVVRDTLAGESFNSVIDGIFNPDKRATGRDVLNNVFGPTDKEDRLSLGGFDIGSFATAVVLDPLLFTGSITGLTKSGRAAQSLAQNSIRKEAIDEALRLARVSGDPNSISSLTRISNDLQSSISAAEKAGVTPIASKLDEFSIFRPSFAEQLDAGHRGFSLSIPFSDKEFVPTALNKFLEKPLEFGFSAIDQLTPRKFEEFFRSSPKQLQIRALKDANKAIQRQTAISETINYLPENLASTDDFNRTIINAAITDPKVRNVIGEGDLTAIAIDPKLIDEVIKREEVRAEINNFSTDVMVGAERLNSLAKIDEVEKNVIGTLDKTYDIRLEKLAAKEARIKSKIDDPVELIRYNDEIEEELASVAEQYETKKAKIAEKYSDQRAKVQKDIDQINSRGELVEDLVNTLTKANQDALTLQKAIGLDIQELDSGLVNYMRQVLTPEAQKYFLEAKPSVRKELRDSFRSDLIERTSVQKKRAFKGLTSVEKNKVLKDKYKVDFNFYNTNPVISMKSLSDEVTRGVGDAITISSAINLTGTRAKEVPNGFVSISEVLSGSNLNAVHLQARLLKGQTSSEELIRVGFNNRLRKDKLAEQLKKNGADVYIPESVARDIGAAQRLNRGDLSSTVSILEPLNAMYRALFTTHPAHLGTNVLGFLHANALAGVFNPVTYSDAAKYVGNFYKKNRPNSAFSKLIKDSSLTNSENAKYLEEFIQSGVADRGLISETQRILDEGIRRSADKFPHLSKAISVLGDNPITRFSKTANRIADETARAAHFVEKRKAGMSILEAEESVRKYLFDYSELTPFEREKLSKFVLFYTFSRKNLPFSIQEVFSNRGARGFAMASRDSLAGQTAVPEYISEAGNIGLEDGSFIDIRNPIFEANKFSPQGGGLSRVLEKVVSQTTPPIKAAIELATGREVFRGRDLSDATRVDRNFATNFLETIGLAQTVETKSGDELRLSKNLVPFASANPAGRFEQTLRDIFADNTTPLDKVINLTGGRVRRNIPEELLAKTLRDKILNIIDDDPRIRTFQKPFSITNEPDEEVSRLLEVLDTTSEVLKRR